MATAKFQNAKKLSLDFFYRHAFTIGVCAFIASLIFSCSFTLQFADAFPQGIPVWKYLISGAVWSRFSLFLAGFALMGGQIITFVMYKKAKKTWVFGLYCGLTFLSICATFGSFAVSLENRRIEAGQSDVGLQALIDQKETLKEAIRLQDVDTKASKKADRITNGVDKIRPARQKNVEELGKINKEIVSYSKNVENKQGEDSITKMFIRTATVVQTLSFGTMQDDTRDTLAMLFECASFLLVAIFLDLVAAFCAALSVRVDESDFQQVVMDEAMEQQHESDFAYIRAQNKLTHDARMEKIKARPVDSGLASATVTASSATPKKTEKVVSPDIAQTQINYSSSYSDGGQKRPPETEETSPKKSSKNKFPLNHDTIRTYVLNAYRTGTDKKNQFDAWIGRRGENGISGRTGISEAMCETIHKILRKNELVHVKVNGRQQWTIPNFPKADMVEKIKTIRF